MGTRAKKISA